MNTNLLKMCIVLLKFVLCSSQRTAYNQTCNSTEECSDHRYACQLDEENVLRCLCDRFHAWDDNVGCVQIYNASEILNMTITVTVTDNLRYLQDNVEFVIKTQIAAGFFVIGMVILATITITTFCIYTHITDRALRKATTIMKRKSISAPLHHGFVEPKPSTSFSVV